MVRPADNPVEPRWQPIFALLAVAMLAKGLLWTYAIPPFDAPDEPAHYSHAQFLALHGRLPLYGTLDSTSPDVSALMSATLVQLTNALPQARLYQERAGAGAVGPAEAEAAHSAQQPPSRTPTGNYGPVGYALYAIPIRLLAGQGIIWQLMAARLVAVLLGTLAVLAVAWAGLEAGLDARMAVAAGMIAGYQPMWSQQTAVVSADAALFCFASLFLALLLRWLRTRSRGVGLAAAVMLSLALLSKPAGLFALPFAALFLLPAVATRGRARLEAVGVGSGLCLIAGVPYAAWNSYRPVGVTGLADRGSLPSYAQLFVDRGFAYPRGVLAGFWGNFGWLEQALSPGLITSLRYATVAAALLCVAALVKRAPGWPGILVGLASFLACAGVAFGFDLLLWLNQHVVGVQGRYLLPALGGAAVALVVAVNGLLPRPAARIVVCVLAGAMALLNFASLAVLSSRLFVA